MQDRYLVASCSLRKCLPCTPLNIICRLVLNLTENDAHLRLGLIAQHFEYGKHLKKAIEYYRRAGDSAFENHSQQEGLAHYRTAMRIVESDPTAAPRSVHCMRKFALFLILYALRSNTFSYLSIYCLYNTKEDYYSLVLLFIFFLITLFWSYPFPFSFSFS